MLLPEVEGVRYVVVWQRQRAFDCEGWRNGLERADVQVVEMDGKGLCRSRNRAIDVAMSSLHNPLEDAVFVIADDDERLVPEVFERLRAVYERYPKMDAALMRLRSSVSGEYFKTYPPKAVMYGRHPRSYYACSWEMTFRARVWHTGLRFDERFGLGSERLCAGEEEVLLTDMLRKGLRVLVVPEDIGFTDPHTTGDKVLDATVLRSKGAVYGYQYGWLRACARSVREAVGIAFRHRANVCGVFGNIWQGVKYIREC